jgi:hypothetical protein
MPAIFELRSALNDRLLRLKEIIAFIRKNGLLSKASRKDPVPVAKLIDAAASKHP